MRFVLRSLLCLGLLTVVAKAQTTRDYAVDLKADLSPTVPRITLSWSLRQAANISAQLIYRRLKGDVLWGSPIATLGNADTSWADTSAVEGVEYEYWLKRTYSANSPANPQGYLIAGINVPPVENRGTTLLVVDASMTGPLTEEIDQLKRDLTGDGWTMLVISAARRDSLTDATAVSDTKTLIKAAYDADPANVKQLYLLGHVPVPYSGSIAPDGHSNHVGAWSADGFYGDMNGTWTDSTVTSTSSTETRIHNVPGDGKLDQSVFPSTLELMVGRVDLSGMQRAPATTVAEATLLRRYLNKAHDFKFKQRAYANVERRVLIRDGFGYFSGENFMMSGWEWAFTCVGRTPDIIIDEPAANQWWSPAAANTYLLANGNGGGSYETCSTVGASVDFGRLPFRAAFVSLFGSYFGDWDSTNNFMRAPLAGNARGDGLGLCCFWAGRPGWFMHHMGMGGNLGYAIRQSLNGTQASVSNPIYTPSNGSTNGVQCGLMGDPSLRMHIVEPPRNLVASSAGGAVSLGWSASTESNLLGYHVYRAATSAGPFTRLTASPLATPSYVDASGVPGSSYTYMVRTLKLEGVPGGTYQNLSIGDQFTIAVSSAAGGIPLNPTGLAVVQNSAANAQLSWQDNASDETGYRVERKVSGAGSWSTLVTLPAGATGCTDTGVFANNEVYYYRVFAVNAAGDSVASNEAGFEATPGYFEFDDTIGRVNKTDGSFVIPVSRFGGVNGPVSVNYATSNSSATAGTHYTSTSGTLNWADGDTSPKLITVPVTNTASPQVARQFRLTLSTPSAGTGIGTHNAMCVLIEDPGATLPAPWQRASIGALTNLGASVQAEGVLSLTSIGGSGLSTTATSEVGNFLCQSKTGDGVLTAYISSALPAESGARFAVMIRADATSGGAVMAGTFVGNSTTGSAARQIYRTTASATGVAGTAVGSIATPCWLRITRAGSSFTAEASTNGTTWIGQGTASIPTMPATAQWGLFHTCDDRSGTTHSANFQTAMFSSVDFTSVSVPGAVGTLSAGAASATSVGLTWTAATSAAGYRIERRTEDGSFSQIIDLPAATLNFTDSSLAPDTAYEYRIYAYNSAGSGPLSPTLQTTTRPNSSVFIISSLTGSGGGDATIKGGATASNFGADTTLRVGGNTSTNTLASTAKAYLRFDLGSVASLGSIASARLRLAVAGIGSFEQAGYSYAATLRMLPEASETWDESSLTWDNAPLNNTTTNGFLAGTTTLATLSFTDPLAIPSVGTIVTKDITGSTLDSGRGPNNIVSIIINTTTTAAWMDFASKEHGTLPPPALELTYSSALPTRPSFLIVTEGAGNNLDLTWTDSTTGETGFEIERRPAGGTFSLLTAPAANSTAFTDSATAQGVVYEYRMRAVGAAGNSAWTPIVAATAGGSTGPLPGERLTFATWMQFANLQSDAAADDDRDGIPNLLEYAFGSPANFGGNSGAPVVGERKIGNDRFLTLTFARRTDVTDVALRVEVSDSLFGPWTELDPLQPENQVAIQANSPYAGWQTITVKDKEPMNGSARRFMRMAATQK